MKKVGRFSVAVVFDELETSCKMAQKEILAHSFSIQKLTDCEYMLLIGYLVSFETFSVFCTFENFSPRLLDLLSAPK